MIEALCLVYVLGAGVKALHPAQKILEGMRVQRQLVSRSLGAQPRQCIGLDIVAETVRAGIDNGRDVVAGQEPLQFIPGAPAQCRQQGTIEPAQDRAERKEFGIGKQLPGHG